MRRLFFVLLALTFAAMAANTRLYLKDGTYHVVREYKVESDRVRFYSVERSEWEEIPLTMVDLKRTESEAAERQEQLEKDAKILTEEDRVQRELDKEIMRIPQDPGSYWVDGTQTKVMKVAEVTVKTNKGRSVLSKLSPIPMVPGKGTVEIQSAHSLNLIANPEQEFYIQLADLEPFGIVKLTSKGGVRIVENLTIVPVSKEVIEERTLVPTFQKQLTPDGLYKIWPREPLEPGEYAVVEYTEGKINIQVWDFAIKK